MTRPDPSRRPPRLPRPASPPKPAPRPARAAVAETPRAQAVAALLRIEEDAAYAARVGYDGPSEHAPEREARFVTEIVSGVTRMKRRLDFLLQSAYRGDLAAMEPTLRQILRMGLYERMFLDTPDHAAVSEAVALAKRLVRPGAAGLVNAVLRTLQRGPLPDPDPSDPIRALAIVHSHPTWMVHRWAERFGLAETEALLMLHNERPVFGVRVNGARYAAGEFLKAMNEAGVQANASPYVPDAFRVARMQPVLPLLKDGRVAVQDDAAALVVHVLDPQPGETVFDVCAAPGGKALYAASRMGRGTVVASDAHAGRLRLVARAAESHGLAHLIETVAEDVEARAASGQTADAVLLDAPCSGTGVVARRADLRWNRSEADLYGLVGVQTLLLDAAAKLVRPGGRLVYSTCSLEPEENEEQIVAFLQRNPAFRVESVAGRVPSAFVTPEGYYAALPHVHGTDGAFAARLVREG
ncbi:MAG: 16S rRNA (cytosine(967)-C(5))-methyltransferase RsmB [Bacteroidetes bacterium]|nr:16S rRNA (cytosine(967)-C(5))-methyltransferase RsmB [Bacteroidota bacterium]